jgi:hypothetical protein
MPSARCQSIGQPRSESSTELFDAVGACSLASRDNHRSLASCVASDGTAKRGIAFRTIGPPSMPAAKTSAVRRFWLGSPPSATGRQQRERLLMRFLANDVADTNDAATKDPGPQSASVHEEADHLWICVPRESCAGFAQVQALQFYFTDEEPFL